MKYVTPQRLEETGPLRGWTGGELQPFSHLADGFRFPRLGETTEVKISALESAAVSFDQ